MKASATARWRILPPIAFALDAGDCPMRVTA